MYGITGCQSKCIVKQNQSKCMMYKDEINTGPFTLMKYWSICLDEIPDPLS